MLVGEEVPMLSDRLRQARQDAQLSIYALAQKSGIRVSSISEIESGKTPNPGILTIVKLADVLNVSLDTLAARVASPPQSTRKSHGCEDDSCPGPPIPPVPG